MTYYTIQLIDNKEKEVEAFVRFSEKGAKAFVAKWKRSFQTAIITRVDVCDGEAKAQIIEV